MAPFQRIHKFWKALASALCIATLVLTCTLAGSAQQPNPVRDMERRAQERLAAERLDRFVEDTFDFFEISGELVAFRVHPNMTDREIDLLDERAQELESQTGRLLSYVRGVAPFVRGQTEGLWIVLDPPDETSTLEERLTLILALVNRLLPKLDELVTMLQGIQGEGAPTVSVEELRLQASSPYFVVGGLEELESLTRDLRRSL